MNVIEKLFGTHSERELKMIRPILAKIENLRPEMIAKSDEELRDQTRILKEKNLSDRRPDRSSCSCDGGAVR